MDENNYFIDKNNIYENIIKNIVNIVNQTGEKIKEYQNIINKLPNNNSNENEKNSNIEINKEIKNNILNIQKEIESNFRMLSTLFTSKINVPEKLFNTICFLQIKFIDLSNLKNNFIDLNFSGNVIKFLYKMFDKKDNNFLKQKIKYLDSIIKLSFSLINNNNLNFDLKNFINEILIFSENILVKKEILDENYKLKLMPGIISNLIKLLDMEIKLNSKELEKIIIIIKMYLNLTLNKLNSNDNNYIKFFEFYEIFILLIKNKHSKFLLNVLNEFIEINLILFSNENINLKSEFLENIFLLINKEILILNNNNLENNNENFLNNFYNNFYEIYSKNKNYNFDLIYEKILNLLNSIEFSYKKKEYLKFNKNLFNFCGYFLSLIYYLKNNKNENKLNSIITKIFDVLKNIINLTESKILFEITNSFELSIKEINIEICKKKIILNFLNNILNTFNLEINLKLFFVFLCEIFKINNEIFKIIYEINIENLLEITKEFNKKINKNKLKSKIQLNNFIKEILNNFTIFHFFIIFPFFIINKNEKINNFILNTKKIKVILNFYYLIFCENTNAEFFEINKISNSYLNLINFYCLNFYNFCNENKIEFDKNEINKQIILSLINYSNKISILKYSSFLLILFISKENDLKNFIVFNFNFIINSILNKVIYFNENNNNNNEKNFNQNKKISNIKISIFNFFNSLLELILQINDDNLCYFYCGEFNKYLNKLFPYIEINIKNKDYLIIEILLEIFYKISSFQNKIIINNIYEKYQKININKSTIEFITNENENFLLFLKEKINIENCNVYRQLILRIIPIVLSKKIILISKCLNIIKEYLPIMNFLPMIREENENFSEEDPSNVSIPSTLGPVMFQIWNYLIFALKNSSFSIVNFKLFFDIFKKIVVYKPKFFDSHKIFDDLLPVVEVNFEKFKENYKNLQFYKIIYDFVFDFLELVIFINKYEKKYKKNFEMFVDKFYKEIIFNKNKDEINEIDNKIKKILNSFNSE